MTRDDGLFLDVLKAAIRGEAYDGPLEASNAGALFRAAEIHSVLPLTAEAVYRRPELKDCEEMKAAQRRAVEQVIRQVTQDNEFLNLLEKLQERGYDPLVVKGLICRALYPKPYLRPSVDEDILVPAADFAAYDSLLVELGGMYADRPDADLDAVHETSYHKADSPLYIELHKSLFEPDSDAYGDCSRPFEDAMERTAAVGIQGLSVRTLDPTDHLLYLILHAFKHFLHSGFGIRYVCDIALFAEGYGTEIRWERVVSECAKLRADRFAAAVFRIAVNHLGMDAAAVPAVWREAELDETPLLEDILTGGLYGVADENRVHSSNITLGARASGHGGSGGLLRSLFPSAEYMRDRFPYLKKCPALLPAAWIQRLLEYGKRTRARRQLSAAESVRIGQERVRLMELYKIIQ